MQNLFFITVATGILSATSFTVKAQPSVNIEQLNTGSIQKSQKFINGIEIHSGTAVLSGNTIMPVNKTMEASNMPAIEDCSSLQFKYAQLLNMDVESLTNKMLFEEIEKWWATNYRYGGTSKKGIDCSAYTSVLLADVYGLSVARTARAQYAECEKVDKADLKQGDLVFFHTKRGVSHVGLYLGNGYFTHAGSSTGVTISNLDETYWNKKFIGGGKIITSTATVE
ncbi:MAG TPA: NlpC/P60 family protein [Ferruginibacter sp.]|nr:NlpC/P60 family protein [Ferruginibacter sp.]